MRFNNLFWHEWHCSFVCHNCHSLVLYPRKSAVLSGYNHHHGKVVLELNDCSTKQPDESCIKFSVQFSPFLERVSDGNRMSAREKYTGYRIYQIWLFWNDRKCCMNIIDLLIHLQGPAILSATRYLLSRLMRHVCAYLQPNIVSLSYHTSAAFDCVMTAF